jgi:hypothetical protein
MWGENPDWLWHQPGFPVRYWLKRGKQKSPAAQKGQTKRAAPHIHAVIRARRFEGAFNLIQIKSTRPNSKKPRR